MALSVGKQAEGIGEVRSNAAMQRFGRLLQGLSRINLGELVAARDLLEEHADPAHTPVDTGAAYLHVLRLAGAGRALVYLGYVDQARTRIGEALSLARRIGSAPSLAFALASANGLDLATGSPLIHAEELLDLSTRQKLGSLLGWAMAFRGLALAAGGQVQEAFALLTQALAQRRAIGAVEGLPVLLAWLAKVAAMLGRPAEAWGYLAEAAQLLETTDERISVAEVLHRGPGDLLNAAGDWSGAEGHYRQAIAVAERQSARMFQLRASISLARLWRDQGRHAEARDLLAPIYGWFTEGFDVPLLKEAKTLLDDLT